MKEVVLKQYDIEDAGIPYRVTLEHAVIAEIDSSSGDVLSTEIPAFDTLMACMAVSRCHRPEKLNGDDLRFMRRVLGLTGKDFAAQINVTPATLSRYEKQKQTLGEKQERLIRLYVVELLHQMVPASMIDRECIFQIGLKTAPANKQALHFTFHLQKHSRKRDGEWDERSKAA